jgi:cyclophilin family peptidyl-prolyl cis-trans isomerase
MNTIRYSLMLVMFVLLVSCPGGTGTSNTIVAVKTSDGDFKLLLYNETPVHRDNFIRLVNSGFYEDVLFHRVINGFMVQAGDPLTKAGSKITEDDSINTYTIQAEFNRKFYHKKGALAAARMGNDVNPLMRSSGTQFYVVQGKKYSDDELASAEQVVNTQIKQSYFVRIFSEITDSITKAGSSLSPSEIQEMATLRLYDLLDKTGEYRMTDEQRNTYKTYGGVPRLDGTYTVFGEVIEGIETIDRIASAQTDSNDRPLNDIKILTMKILK